MDSMTPLELQRRLAEGQSLRLLDVREREEWDFCRIPEGVLRPLSEADAWLMKEAKGELPVVVYCHHGIRSARVCAALLHLGHEDVRNLAGGIEAWRLEVDPAMPAYSG